MSILTQTFIPFSVSGFGDIVDIPEGTTGTLDTESYTLATDAICGLNFNVVFSAEDDCFFPDSNPCAAPVWTLLSGTLPFGVRLSATSGVYTVASTIALIRGNGANEFTVAMTDVCGNVVTETYYTITSPGTPAGGGTTSGCWTLGSLWSITTLCAYQGTYGLQRTANGVLGSSDVTNSNIIDTSEGQTYFIAFWLKGSGGADGTIGMGLAFYDSVGAHISDAFVDSTGSPVVWTKFSGNVTAPANAVTAVPTIRATGHLTGTWCLDNPYLVLTGGYFVLSGLKHYYSEFTGYR